MACLVLAALAAAATVERRLCEPGDYTATYAACAGSTRKAQLTLPDTCSAPAASRNLSYTETSCACREEDYAPVYLGTCGDDGLQSFRLALKVGVNAECTPNPDLLRKLCPNSPDGDGVCGKTLCRCTDDDVASAFTPCDPATQTRKLVSYWRKRCEPDGMVLPRPSESHSCAERCGVGFFLAPPSEVCSMCKAGESSTTEEVYAAPWTALPPPMFVEQARGSAEGKQFVPAGNYLASRPEEQAAMFKIWLTVEAVPASLEMDFRIVSKVLPHIGELYVYVDGFYAQSVTTQDEWGTLKVDLIDREYCLWEAAVLDTSNLPIATHCVKSNHILPYSPAWGLTTADNDETFNVQVVADGDNPCRITRPAGVSFGAKWLALVPEALVDADNKHKCTWEGVVSAVKAEGGGAVIFETSRELNAPHETHLHEDQALPVVYLRDVDPASLANAGKVTFKQKEYATGTTEVSVVYAKGAGIDTKSSVHIREMRIAGTRTSAEACFECPAGTFSEAGSSEGCQRCPAGSYAPQPGAAACLPCANGRVSLDRQNCLEAPCTNATADYRPTLGECEWIKVAATSCDGIEDCECVGKLCQKRRRVVSYYSSACDDTPTAGVTRPTDGEALCEPCPPGQFRDQGLTCRACPLGTISDSTTTAKTAAEACTACADETVPIPSMAYPAAHKWHPRADGLLCENQQAACPWSKQCVDGTDETCWLAAYADPTDYTSAQVLREGEGLMGAGDVDQRLSFTADYIPNIGALSFAWSLTFVDPADLPSVRVKASLFSVTDAEDIRVWGDLASATSGAITSGFIYRNYTIPNIAGRATFHLEYIKTRATKGDVVFTLHALDAAGVANGGSATCAPCPDGTICKKGIPEACPPGTHPVNGECQECPGNTYAAFNGSTSCTPCPRYLVASASKTRCEPPPGCEITLLGADVVAATGAGSAFPFTYDLSKLGDNGQLDIEPWEVKEGDRGVRRTVSLCPTNENAQYAVVNDPKKLTPTVLGRVLTAAVDEVDHLVLTLSDGDHCTRANGTLTRNKVVISLLCDGYNIGINPGATKDIKMYLDRDAGEETDPCVTHYHIFTPFACRQCPANFYELVERDECLNGVKSFSWLAPSPCIGNPPAAVADEPCTTETTKKHASQLIYVVVGVSILAAGILGYVAFSYYQRTQVLRTKYAMLSAMGTNEMRGTANPVQFNEDDEGDYTDRGVSANASYISHPADDDV